MAEQLVLNLPVRTAFGRDNFFVSSANTQAVAAVEDWARWPLGKLVLSGPPGAGKSHLACIWADMSGAAVVSARGLADHDLTTLGQTGAAVEDVPLADPADQEALFHLHNLAAAEGAPLLMTGRDSSARWGLGLPDLASRIAAALEVQVGAPDDNLLHALMIKLFADRQVDVHPRVMRQIVQRMDRSFAGAEALVDRLDRAALARKTAISAQLVREMLAETKMEDQ